MSEHAKLSASGAHRWMLCAASVRMEDGLPDTTSEFAEEGTRAHELAESCLRNSVQAKAIGVLENEDPDSCNEMRFEVQKFLDYVNGIPGELFVEKRVDFSEWVPGGFGTADAIKIAEGVLTVIDLKYGKGIPVYAEDNPQAMLYALGAVAAYDFLYEFDTVKMVIHQPRLDNVSEWEISKDELLTWGECVVKTLAENALQDDAEFNPGEKQCQFCKIKTTCAARSEFLFNDVVGDFVDLSAELVVPALETLTNERIARILPHASSIKKLLDEMKAHAKTELEAGRDFPNYKLVTGQQGDRKWADPEAASRAMARVKIPHAERYTSKLISPTQAGKLIGDDHRIMTKYVTRSPGAPTLVPISDKREALEYNFAQDFEMLEN